MPLDIHHLGQLEVNWMIQHHARRNELDVSQLYLDEFQRGVDLLVSAWSQHIPREDLEQLVEHLFPLWKRSSIERVVSSEWTAQGSTVLVVSLMLLHNNTIQRLISCLKTILDPKVVNAADDTTEHQSWLRLLLRDSQEWYLNDLLEDGVTGLLGLPLWVKKNISTHVSPKYKHQILSRRCRNGGGPIYPEHCLWQVALSYIWAQWTYDSFSHILPLPSISELLDHCEAWSLCLDGTQKSSYWNTGVTLCWFDIFIRSSQTSQSLPEGLDLEFVINQLMQPGVFSLLSEATGLSEVVLKSRVFLSLKKIPKLSCAELVSAGDKLFKSFTSVMYLNEVVKKHGECANVDEDEPELSKMMLREELLQPQYPLMAYLLLLLEKWQIRDAIVTSRYMEECVSFPSYVSWKAYSFVFDYLSCRGRFFVDTSGQNVYQSLLSTFVPHAGPRGFENFVANYQCIVPQLQHLLTETERQYIWYECHRSILMLYTRRYNVEHLPMLRKWYPSIPELPLGEYHRWYQQETSWKNPIPSTLQVNEYGWPDFYAIVRRGEPQELLLLEEDVPTAGSAQEPLTLDDNSEDGDAMQLSNENGTILIDGGTSNSNLLVANELPSDEANLNEDQEVVVLDDSDEKSEYDEEPDEEVHSGSSGVAEPLDRDLSDNTDSAYADDNLSHEHESPQDEVNDKSVEADESSASEERVKVLSDGDVADDYNNTTSDEADADAESYSSREDEGSEVEVIAIESGDDENIASEGHDVDSDPAQVAYNAQDQASDDEAAAADVSSAADGYEPRHRFIKISKIKDRGVTPADPGYDAEESQCHTEEEEDRVGRLAAWGHKNTERIIPGKSHGSDQYDEVDAGYDAEDSQAAEDDDGDYNKGVSTDRKDDCEQGFDDQGYRNEAILFESTGAPSNKIVVPNTADPGYDAESSQAHTEEEGNPHVVSQKAIVVSVSFPVTHPRNEFTSNLVIPEQSDPGYDAEDSQGHSEEEEELPTISESKESTINHPPAILPASADIDPGYEGEESQCHTEDEEKQRMQLGYEAEESQGHTEDDDDEMVKIQKETGIPVDVSKDTVVPVLMTHDDSHTLSDMSAADERTMSVDEDAGEEYMEVEDLEKRAESVHPVQHQVEQHRETIDGRTQSL
jgi:hypothetical protein